MKPRIAYRVPATREAVEKAFGPQSGALFVPNPLVAAYAVVLRFPGTKVIVSGEIDRALRRVASDLGPILVIARDLTVEARHAAAEAGCDVITAGEFGWTDASYGDIRRR